ncbi:hypothetical protein TrST_g6260 [Triparma strigata]|nr:hypothetical protein TrST_g6260 [Triparma strigata]
MLLFILFGLIISQLCEIVLHRYHIYSIPGSGAVMLVGIIFGSIVCGISDSWGEKLDFNEHLFALIFLPVIIFQSGYSLSLSRFFKRIGKILTFAFLGTFITTMFIGGSLYGLSDAGLTGQFAFNLPESFAFAALISAIDPVATLCTFGCLKVEPNLSVTIMGESVVNDAVSLALYRAFQSFILEKESHSESNAANVFKQMGYFLWLISGSTLIGAIVGLLCTFQIKMVSQRMGMNVQATVIILWSYVAFAMAEALQISGIIASMVCGIIMNHFCKKNLAKEQKAYVNKVLLLIASFSDMCIFFLAGLSIAVFIREADYELVLWLTPLCLIGRALNVFPLSAVLNKADPKDQITKNEQVIMWHAGLRGAIAFSIALHFPDRCVLKDDDGEWLVPLDSSGGFVYECDPAKCENGCLRGAVIDTTSMIILLSVFMLGGTTKKMLDYMQIQTGVVDSHEEHKKAISEAVNDSKWKKSLRKLDRAMMQKLLVKKKMRRSSTDISEDMVGLDREDEIDKIIQKSDEDDEALGCGVPGGGGGVGLVQGENSNNANFV